MHLPRALLRDPLWCHSRTLSVARRADKSERGNAEGAASRKKRLSKRILAFPSPRASHKRAKCFAPFRAFTRACVSDTLHPTRDYLSSYRRDFKSHTSRKRETTSVTLRGQSRTRQIKPSAKVFTQSIDISIPFRCSNRFWTVSAISIEKQIFYYFFSKQNIWWCQL